MKATSEQNETGRILYRGMAHLPYKAVGALCADGVRRTVRLGREPDTFFSIPGSVQVKGRTVSGFVTSVPGFTEAGDDLRFTAVQTGKNAGLLPEA